MESTVAATVLLLVVVSLSTNVMPCVSDSLPQTLNVLEQCSESVQSTTLFAIFTPLVSRATVMGMANLDPLVTNCDPTATDDAPTTLVVATDNLEALQSLQSVQPMPTAMVTAKLPLRTTP